MAVEKGAVKTFSLGLGLTNACNLACAHCYRPTARVDHLTLAQVRLACESLPLRAVNLGTGESALHPELPAILEYLLSLGVKVAVTSNGHTLSLLDDADLRRLDSVELSLDFPTEAEQDAFRGAGNWRLVLRQVQRAVGAGVPATITAVMMNTNYARLPRVARVAASLGATCRVNVYQSVRTDAFALTYEQFWSGWRGLLDAGALVTCNEPVVRAALGIREPRAGGCGQTTVRVTPRGEVLPCVFWPEPALRLEDLARLREHIVETPQFRSLNVLPRFCRTCDFRESCAGGCAGRRRLRGALDQPDEFCPFLHGERTSLTGAHATARDLPKAASACTVIFA